MLDNKRLESAYVVVLQYDEYMRPSEAREQIEANAVPPRPHAGRLRSGEWGIIPRGPEQERTAKPGLIKDAGAWVGAANKRWVRGHLARDCDRAQQPQNRLF
eukprot:3285025-Pyramimonas_sp.AAC.1